MRTAKRLKELLPLALRGMALAAAGMDAGMLMAAAANLPDAGKTRGGNERYKGTTEPHDTAGAEPLNPANPEGILTESYSRIDGDAEMYQKDIDERITRIRPMATPVDQIARYAAVQHASSFEVKYYSVGTRPVKTTLVANVAASETATSVALQVADPDMFTLDDTIRVVGVKGTTNYRGSAYDPDASDTPDLVLCVCGKTSEGQPIVYAVNGRVVGQQNIGVPAIQRGTVLIRMGKSCGELDVQTGRFNNLPVSNMQYCQNFMAQIEQSTLDKIANKEVNWGFSDIEEDSIYDMRLAMENSFLFGDMNCVKHTSKDGMAQWFTKGIWWQAGKDLEVGERVDDEIRITDATLVDVAKDLFVGTGIGNKRKVLLCGSDFLAALSKLDSQKFRMKATVEVWNLKFRSWETDFGEILAMHDELFDLKSAGVRNTDAVVIQEISCLYLRYANAHARLKLTA